jgi:hypothetical protein
MKKETVVMLCSMLVLGKLAAQADSSIYDRAVAAAVSEYKRSAGNNDLLFIGTEYSNYSHGINGHPFLNTDSFRLGSVMYNGAMYYNVPMLYDILRDELVIKYLNTNNPMKLVSEKIRSFDLDGRHFVRVDLPAPGPASGFYELVFEKGNTSLLVKHNKEIKVPANTERPSYFLYWDLHFIRIGDKFFAANNREDIPLAFGDQKANMKKLLKTINTSFKKGREQYIREAIILYQSLKKE